MKNTGLFIGGQVGGAACFQPDKTVSRGEFVTMLVKALDLKVDETAELTDFADDAPNWLKPYLAAALRNGMTENWPDSQVFGAAAPITGAEAALLVQNALDLTIPTVAGKENEGELPVWAETAVTAISEIGIEVDPTAELTRETVAGLLYQVSRLHRTLPGSQVY
jgi:hypothetical protein